MEAEVKVGVFEDKLVYVTAGGRMKGSKVSIKTCEYCFYFLQATS